MKLEAQTLAKIRNRINEKVMKSCGTWIDWQYLLDAAALLAKCRYTLQYTYPYAYYMEPSNRKKLVRLQSSNNVAFVFYICLMYMYTDPFTIIILDCFININSI